MTDPGHRAGVVALLGRPNAGKSTLLNRLLGEKLAITTPKPQTTRSRILGILTLPEAQVLLVDTPGMHSGSKLLNLAMTQQVEEAARNCDAALLLVDLTVGWDERHSDLTRDLRAAGTPFLVVGSKLDLLRGPAEAWPSEAPEPLQISARTGEGIDTLREAVVALLPESPQLYPGDQLSDRPLRFLAAELVREAAFEELSQELPYSLAVEVEEFDEKHASAVRIRANLILERNTQKAMVIGEGGRMIKRIGVRARREVEKLVGRKVHLELWVKVEPKWSKHPRRLRSLGYW